MTAREHANTLNQALHLTGGARRLSLSSKSLNPLVSDAASQQVRRTLYGATGRLVAHDHGRVVLDVLGKLWIIDIPDDSLMPEGKKRVLI